MRLQAVPIDYIDRENFLRYGEVIEVRQPDPGRAKRGEDEYRTLSRESSTGWRVSMYCVRARWSKTLQAYDSRRLLTPQSGIVLLCVAPPNRPDDVQLFVLDRAVALHKGVPHVLLSLSAESWVQVQENFEARSEPHTLRKTLVPAGVWD